MKPRWPTTTSLSGLVARLHLVLFAVAVLSTSLFGTTKAEGIEEILDEVSGLRLGGHIAALEFPRFTVEELDLAKAYITGQLQSYGYLVTYQPVLYSENIIARLPGTVEPERIFVVGAHFDTVMNSPGADDNASGVAALLEIARILSTRDLPFSVEFVAFALEELYVKGSVVYVEHAVEQGLDIFGMINFDMIGYTCSQTGCQNPIYGVENCFYVEPEGVDTGTYAATLVNLESRELLDEATFAASVFVPELELVEMQVEGDGECLLFTRRSDHYPFWLQDFPALHFFNTYGDRNPYYHTPSDLLVILDLEFCLRITQTALATVLLSETSEAPIPPVPRRFADNLTAWPNPARSSALVRFGLARDADVGLSVYDVRGRRVRILGDHTWRQGTHEVTWDLRDDGGRRLADGVYFVRLDSEGRAKTHRVTLIK